MLNDALAMELHQKAIERLNSRVPEGSDSPMTETMQSIAVDAAIAVLWEYFESQSQT